MIGIVNNATDVLNVGPESVAGVPTQNQAASHDPNALTLAISSPDYSSETCTQPDGPAAEEPKRDTVVGNVTVDATYPGIHKLKKQYYTLAGSLEATGSITIKLDAYLYVEGRIRAGGDIIVDNGVRAGWGIKAKGNIRAKSLRAGRGISAGKDIETEWCIDADDDIIAGKSIRAGEGIRSDDYIHAYEGIEAGLDINSAYGVSAMTTIKCRRLFAGMCRWRECTPDEQRVVCTEFQGNLVCGNLVKAIPQEHKAPLRLIISGVLS